MLNQREKNGPELQNPDEPPEPEIGIGARQTISSSPKLTIELGMVARPKTSRASLSGELVPYDTN